MDYKKTNAPINTVTRDMMDLCKDTGNVYETVCIIAKRANQIAVEIPLRRPTSIRMTEKIILKATNQEIIATASSTAYHPVVNHRNCILDSLHNVTSVKLRRIRIRKANHMAIVNKVIDVIVIYSDMKIIVVFLQMRFSNALD